MKLIVCVLAAIIATVGSCCVYAADAEDWQVRFGAELKAGLREIGLPQSDANWILEPLAVSGKIAPQVEPEDSLRGRQSWSLQDYVVQRAGLRRLERTLRRRAPVKIPEMGPYELVDRYDELPKGLQALYLLRGIAAGEGALASETSIRAIQEDGPLRWRTPIRVLATGDADYNRIISTVLQSLRQNNPHLPIDARSLTTSLEEANVFLHYGPYECPKATACRRMDWSRLPADLDTTKVRGTHSWLVPLYFYGQVRNGKWRSDAPIYPLPAQGVTRAATAWLRTDGNGGIVTAMCTHVLGLGFKSFVFKPDVGSDRPANGEIAQSVETCLAASLGAPRPAPLAMHVRFPAINDDSQGDRADQIAVLRTLY